MGHPSYSGSCACELTILYQMSRHESMRRSRRRCSSALLPLLPTTFGSTSKLSLDSITMWM